MKSRLADTAHRDLDEDLRRMTPEQRLAAYLAHCQLMAQLRLAGQTDRPRPTSSSPSDAD